MEIDDEVRSIVNSGMVRAEKILNDNIDLLHKLSKELLEREILDSEEINRIIQGEDLPPVPKEEPKSEKKTPENVPDHVKKLMDQRKEKDPAVKDDSN